MQFGHSVYPAMSPNIRAHDCDMNTHLAAKKKKREGEIRAGQKKGCESERVGVGVTSRGAGIFGTTAVAALLAVCTL